MATFATHNDLETTGAGHDRSRDHRHFANRNAGPIVQTEYGALQGGISDGIYTYFGVPYAEANERFVPAEKLTPWSGVRNATDLPDPESPLTTIKRGEWLLTDSPWR